MTCWTGIDDTLKESIAVTPQGLYWSYYFIHDIVVSIQICTIHANKQAKRFKLHELPWNL